MPTGEAATQLKQPVKSQSEVEAERIRREDTARKAAEEETRRIEAEKKAEDERRRAEIERKKEEAENNRLAMVANTTNNIVIIADATGRIEWVNRAFTTITGHSFEEVIGKKPGDLLQGPDSDKGTIAFISKQLANAKAFIRIADEHGTYRRWFDALPASTPREQKALYPLFRETFKFMGPETTKCYLMGVGKIEQSHEPRGEGFPHLLGEAIAACSHSLRAGMPASWYTPLEARSLTETMPTRSSFI